MKTKSKGKKALLFLAVISVSLLLAMYCDPIGYRYNRSELPETPVNLQEFNSRYDDYNSTAPSLGNLIPFCFSSNRKSQGEHFDVIYMPMNVNFDKSTGILKVTNEYANWGIRAENFGEKVNTADDEYRSIFFYEGVDRTRDMMLFSSNRTGSLGGFDLYFAGIHKD
jgi:hypothetical protein